MLKTQQEPRHTRKKVKNNAVNHIMPPTDLWMLPERNVKMMKIAMVSMTLIVITKDRLGFVR